MGNHTEQEEGRTRGNLSWGEGEKGMDGKDSHLIPSQIFYFKTCTPVPRWHRYRLFFIFILLDLYSHNDLF